MNKILILTLTLLLIGCTMNEKNQKKGSKFSVNGKEVIVFTTANNTDLRLSLTDKMVFENAKQPTESEVSVFVNAVKEVK
jgi:glucosylceramidase